MISQLIHPELHHGYGTGDPIGPMCQPCQSQANGPVRVHGPLPELKLAY